MFLFVTVAFSCSSISKVVYNQNSKLKSKEYYLKLFSKNDFDENKIFFPIAIKESDKIDFFKKIHSNEYYFYFWSFKKDNNKYYFKNNGDKIFGCQQVINSIQNETSYPFLPINESEIYILDNMFSDKNNINLSLQNKKTIVFVYNHVAGKIFFKDTKLIIDYIKQNDEFDYIVLFSDFFE